MSRPRRYPGIRYSMWNAPSADDYYDQFRDGPDEDEPDPSEPEPPEEDEDERAAREAAEDAAEFDEHDRAAQREEELLDTERRPA